MILHIKEAPNGDIYICGWFTGVSNGGSAVPNTKHLAKWSKANQQWESVVDSLPSIAFATRINFDADGVLYIGTLANPGSIDGVLLYKWDGTTLTDLQLVSTEIDPEYENVVNAIAIGPDGVVWVGGEYNHNYTTKYGLGYVSGEGVTWISLSPIQIKSLHFLPNGNLVIGSNGRSYGRSTRDTSGY